MTAKMKKVIDKNLEVLIVSVEALND